MLADQRKLLDDPNLPYISLGITENGIPRQAISVPWDFTPNAYNMKVPNIYIGPEDLKDPLIMDKLVAEQPITVYTFVPLEDYSFLSHFHELQVVFIRQGNALHSLDFLAGCPNWYQLLVEDAQIPTLDPLFPNGRKGLRSYCLNFIDCQIGDISSLKQEGIFLSELHILQDLGTNEKDRWKTVRCSKFRYNEYDREAYFRSLRNRKQKD